MKQKLTELKEERHKSVVIVGDFNNQYSIMDRTTEQKINKEQGDLNNSINQVDLTDIFTALHPTIAEDTYFSRAHGILSKRDHRVSHKTKLNKCIRFEIL